MDFSKYQNKISLKWLVGLSVAVLLGILFLGLRPKGFNFSNNVEWITDQSGIRFGKYGIAYTKPFIDSIEKNLSDTNGFSIEIALKPLSYNESGFNFILALHNGKDGSQLLMGQWRSWIILMNGDDYAHKRRTKRIAVKIASPTPIKRLATITTGKEGTKIYFDGQLARTKKDFALKIPDGDKSRLLLGNSVYGKHSWKGDVYGLAFYRYTLTAQDAALHFKRWSKDQDFAFAKKDRPLLLYLFDENQGERALDHAGGNHHLQIPTRMQILERKTLAPPWHWFEFNRSLIQDIIVNLVGFIPFGFVLTATLIKLGGTFEKHGVIIAVALCFSVSLLIEIVQAWIPSRSSAGLDLVLNTFGALIGAITYKFFNMGICSEMKGKGLIIS